MKKRTPLATAVLSELCDQAVEEAHNIGHRCAELFAVNHKRDADVVRTAECVSGHDTDIGATQQMSAQVCRVPDLLTILLAGAGGALAVAATNIGESVECRGGNSQLDAAALPQRLDHHVPALRQIGIDSRGVIPWAMKPLLQRAQRGVLPDGVGAAVRLRLELRSRTDNRGGP